MKTFSYSKISCCSIFFIALCHSFIPLQKTLALMNSCNRGLHRSSTACSSREQSFVPHSGIDGSDVVHKPESDNAVIRRSHLRFMTFLLVGTVSAAAVGMDKLSALADTETPDSIGVDRSGLFSLCPDDQFLTSCVSSQDDRPAVFVNPWCYDGSDYHLAKRILIDRISQIPRASVKERTTMDKDDRFIAVEFESSNEVIDDCEFYFTPNDNTIQFRSIRRGNLYDFGANRKRLEQLRIAANFEIVPVLRNRRRALLFLESPFDSFGPPTGVFTDELLDELSGDGASGTNKREGAASTSLGDINISTEAGRQQQQRGQKGVIGELDPKAPVWEAPLPYSAAVRRPTR